MSEKLYWSRSKSARIGLRELIDKEFHLGYLCCWTLRKYDKKYMTDDHGDILFEICWNNILIKDVKYDLLKYMEKINVLP